MFSKLLVFLSFSHFVLTTEERSTCTRNRAILEAPGDAVLSVFVDAHHGSHCNISTIKGYEQVSTALYVVQTLNKFDYVPGIAIGLKVFDTCHDEMTLYKRALQATVDLDCVGHYDLGILVPASYGGILEPLRNYSVLPISMYKEQDLTKPLINVLVHYLTTRFETIDLVLTRSDTILDYFLESTKEAGICVKSHADILDSNLNNGETVITLIGYESDIREWIQKGEKVEGLRRTWVVLPLDRSRIDDLLPPGSYLIRPEPFDINLLEKFPLVENFLETNGNTVVHSPYLLGIGKAIIELAEVLDDLQKRSCPRATNCVMPRFNPQSRRELRTSDVYDTLHILPKFHSSKYVALMKNNHREFAVMAIYKVEVAKLRVTPETKVPRMPRLCLKKFASNCEKCLNFQTGLERRSILKDFSNKGFLKPGDWVPICLTIVVCGTFASTVIAIFIIYRFVVEEILDGNPTLTIVLILANIFTLQTVLLYCMEDDYFGQEYLNSRKILLTTLAFGMIFSVMLSRALFLAFSTGGLYTTHINGYLQGLMMFFMSGVQIAISITYFMINTNDSAIVARGLTFIGLLAYDIFLLVTLFAVCCFVGQIKRNYCEGKCFFGTVIGLLITWAIWMTCFILMEPETRDIAVCFGIISTAYLIILGVLIPRTYYMITHLARGKKFGQRFDPIDLGPDPRINAIARQSRFCDYVHPAIGSTNTNNLQVPVYPNYYGNSSPNPRYLSRCRSPNPRRTKGYNNYGFHTEMKEIDNAYTVPRVYIENGYSGRNSIERDNDESTYARPKNVRKKRVNIDEDCIESSIYVEERLSPSRRPPDEVYPSRCSSPRLGQVDTTIREEDEGDEEDAITKITRF